MTMHRWHLEWQPDSLGHLNWELYDGDTCMMRGISYFEVVRGMLLSCDTREETDESLSAALDVGAWFFRVPRFVVRLAVWLENRELLRGD